MALMLDHQDVPVLRDHPHHRWEAASKSRLLAFKALGVSSLAVMATGFFSLNRGFVGVLLVVIGGAGAAWSTRLRDRLENSKPSLEEPLSDRDQIQLDNWVRAKGGAEAAQFVAYKFGRATYGNASNRILTVQQGVAKGQFTRPSDR